LVQLNEPKSESEPIEQGPVTQRSEEISEHGTVSQKRLIQHEIDPETGTTTFRIAMT